MIKEWFADYFLHTSDITFDFTRGQWERYGALLLGAVLAVLGAIGLPNL